MKKKQIKFIGLSILVLILLGFCIYKFVDYRNSYDYKLKTIGYSKDEITTIKEKLDKSKIDDVLKMEYINKLEDIITNEYYIDYNLSNYIEYSNKVDKTIDDVIRIVNVKANNEFYSNKIPTDLSNPISILVNKYYYLDESYNVDDLKNISIQYAYNGHKAKEEATNAYHKMAKAALEDGHRLIVNSSFRTYKEQKTTYDKYDDSFAARPGHSEHETGLALDIISSDSKLGSSFHLSDAYNWLINNSYKYGFILRYPEGKEYLTGYSYESWHYRYLGIDLATKVYNSNLTYDEYYAYYCEYKKAC